MEQLFYFPYHEAAHVVAGWVLGLPIDRVIVDKAGWGVKKSRWHSLTRQFHAVSQETVRRDVIFCLVGDCGEMLVGGEGAHLYEHDDHLARTLSRKFALDLASLRQEAFHLVLTHKHTIASIAQKLRQKAEKADIGKGDTIELFSSYEMALERMNWLARGKC